MNPGIPEEVGSTARQFITSLARNPIILALVAINLALVAFLYVQAGYNREEHNHDLELLYRNRTEVGQLLARCNFIPLPPTQQ